LYVGKNLTCDPEFIQYRLPGSVCQGSAVFI